MQLPHADPTAPRRFGHLFARATCNRPLLWVSRHLSWRLDPWLLRATGGRFSCALGTPVALLDTTGARTGLVRRHAVIYFHDGDRVVVVASQAGAPQHPAWFHNLVAHPVVALNERPMRASVAEEDERRRLWPLADAVFPPFATYRRWTAAHGREIPIVVLDPVA